MSSASLARTCSCCGISVFTNARGTCVVPERSAALERQRLTGNPTCDYSNSCPKPIPDWPNKCTYQCDFQLAERFPANDKEVLPKTNSFQCCPDLSNPYSLCFLCLT